jgi:hypothetical protein
LLYEIKDKSAFNAYFSYLLSRAFYKEAFIF